MNKQTFWLIGTPEHANLGDHLITEGQLYFLKENFVDIDIKEVSLNDYYDLKPYLKKLIKEDDILIFNGGGSVGNIWPRGEALRRDAFVAWPDNQKIVFPQSIYFTEDEAGAAELESTKESLTNNLYMGCRDVASYEFAKENFSCESYLTPDIVLGREYPGYEVERQGVLLSIRTDKESALTEEERSAICEVAKSKADDFNTAESKATSSKTGDSTDAEPFVTYFDTVRDKHISLENRYENVELALRTFASAKLVVTDRLHGMLFACVTGTPCYVLENSYFKVRAQYEWIKDCEYIKLFDSVDELISALKETDLDSLSKQEFEPLKDEFAPLKEVLAKCINDAAKPETTAVSEPAPASAPASIPAPALASKLTCEKKASAYIEGETSPLVSVVIPVYNVEAYLKPCIDSILSQTLKNIEIICINDGSTDGSLELLKALTARDERVSIYSQENSGLSATRNRGIELVKGKYIYYMDSDDILELDALETLARRMDADELELIYFDGKGFSDDEYKEAAAPYITLYQRNNSYIGVYEGAKLMQAFYTNKEYRPSACLQMISRKYLAEHNFSFYEGILHEDNLYTFQTLLNAKRVGYEHAPFFNRRVRGESIMFGKKSFNNVRGYFTCYLNMQKALASFIADARGFDPDLYYTALKLVDEALYNARRIYEKLPKGEQGAYRIYEDRNLFKGLVVDFLDERHKLENSPEMKRLSELSKRATYYNRARVDIKNAGKRNDIVTYANCNLCDREERLANIKEVQNAITFSEVAGAKVTKQSWGADRGFTYVLEGDEGVMEMKLSCQGAGSLLIKLRGMQDMDSEKKAIPWWINYKSVKVNGTEMLEKQSLTWYYSSLDLPIIAVEEGEEIQLRIEFESGEKRFNSLLKENAKLKKTINSTRKANSTRRGIIHHR